MLIHTSVKSLDQLKWVQGKFLGVYRLRKPGVVPCDWRKSDTQKQERCQLVYLKAAIYHSRTSAVFLDPLALIKF